MKDIENKSVNERRAIAVHEDTSKDVLLFLSTDHNENVRGSVGFNKNCPLELFETFLNDTYEVKESIAMNSNCPSHILRILVEEDDEEFGLVTCSVAGNSNCPMDLIEKFIEEEEFLWAIAMNPSAPIETLEKLSDSEDEDCRLHVAYNSSSSHSVLNKLSKDWNYQIRAGVAYNPSATLKILNKLSSDESEYVRQSIAQNPIISSQLITKLLKNNTDDVKIKRSICYHDKTPKVILEELSCDEDIEVRDLANEALKKFRSIFD